MKNSNILQQYLFDNTQKPGILINDAAQAVGVSTATIRNWVKTGSLKKHSNGLIDKKSFNLLINSVIGKEKLNSRANKSQKDSHDHRELTSLILKKLSTELNTAESIGSIYEDSLSNSYRNKEGIYYTPRDIVEDLLPSNNGDLSEKSFLDPSCGSGNFIIRAIEIGFKPKNVYGFDIDPIAVEITKKRILDKTGYTSDKIFKTNFLEYIGTNNNLKFDYIYTNPPWGKKITKEEKEKFANQFNAGKSYDTSALFFFASLYCLKKNGTLGFLLPEAFFNISTFESARIKSLNLKIERLIDYGKSFKGLLTKAQAIVLLNKDFENKNNKILCHVGKTKFYRPISSFFNNPKSIINFHCNTEEANVIDHVYSFPHITLKEKAKWGLGIVTGNNKKFGKMKLENGLIPVYKGSDITKNGLKSPSLFIPSDLNLYQQVAPLKLYKSPKKLIYKFISSKLCFYYDTEQRFILNSANMLIPTNELPISGNQLSELLSSNFMNWLFASIFNTHKILRGDLELLPIHNEYFNIHKKFNETTFLQFLKIEDCNNGTYRIKK